MMPVWLNGSGRRKEVKECCEGTNTTNTAANIASYGYTANHEERPGTAGAP
jgi:hypothetical protein